MEAGARSMLRRRSGLTLFELGRRAGKSAGTLSQWERGQVELTVEDVEKIARVIEDELNRIAIPSTRKGIASALAGQAEPVRAA
jgi:transcriptional regulator with XRE-family HTH domain